MQVTSFKSGKLTFSITYLLIQNVGVERILKYVRRTGPIYNNSRQLLTKLVWFKLAISLTLANSYLL